MLPKISAFWWPKDASEPADAGPKFQVHRRRRFIPNVGRVTEIHVIVFGRELFISITHG
jgi:hypothetical protein